VAPESTPSHATFAPLGKPGAQQRAAPSTLAAARAIAEAVFARCEQPPDRARLDWLEVELGDFLMRVGTQSRLTLSVTIWAVTWIAPLLRGRCCRLGSLPLRERQAALVRLESRFPEPLLAVKALLCLLYYEHPDAAREVGVTVPHLVATSPSIVRVRRAKDGP
jgi:hypothetical protein